MTTDTTTPKHLAPFSLKLTGRTEDGSTDLRTLAIDIGKDGFLRFTGTDGHPYALHIDGALAALLRDTLVGAGGVPEEYIWRGHPRISSAGDGTRKDN